MDKIREKFGSFRRPRPEKSASEIAEAVLDVRSMSNIIVFTGNPYENNWRGVYNSAIQMFPNAVVGVPHQSSQNVYSKKEISIICDSILEAKFEKIIFSGYGQCLRVLLFQLHKQANDVLKKNFFLIYHGSLSQHADGAKDAKYLKEIIQLQQLGIFHKIGFVKKGLSETMNKISGVEGEYLINIVHCNTPTISLPSEGLNIGVFTHNSFRKNLHNQVAAALMFSEAVVHVHQDYQYDYLQSDARFRIHPFSESYDEFLKTLGSMTLNFYVTFSECYGLVIAESLSLGVPCLASCSSGLFDYDESLKKWLVVDDYDNPEAIFRQGQHVLENRDEIVSRGKEYIRKLNTIAAEKLTAFLND